MRRWPCEHGRLDPRRVLSERRGIVPKRFLDVLAHEGEVALQDLDAERFLRPEVIGERTLRHPAAWTISRTLAPEYPCSNRLELPLHGGTNIQLGKTLKLV